MVERDDYRVVGIVHVIEDATTVLIESARCHHTWYLRAGHPNSVPPAARRLFINLGAGDMGEGNFDLTSERPELIHAFDFEDGIRAANRYADQPGLRLLRSGRKYDDPE